MARRIYSIGKPGRGYFVSMQALHHLSMIVPWLHEFCSCLLIIILSVLLCRLHNVPSQPDPRPQENKMSGLDPHFDCNDSHMSKTKRPPAALLRAFRGDAPQLRLVVRARTTSRTPISSPGFDPRDHRFRRQLVGVVKVWMNL